MKHLVFLMIFCASLIAWSPNTNSYSVKKTEIDDALAAKLGISLDDEVSYLESKIISGKERLVRIKINESRINVTNAKSDDKKPKAQPLFVTSESENQKTGYYNNYILKNDKVDDVADAELKDEFNNLVCYYLDYEGRYIEFWYLPETLSFLEDKNTSVETHTPEAYKMLLSPNPANANVELQLDADKSQQINIEIYDSNGNLVKQLLDNYISSGNNSINCDLSDIQVGMYSVICIADGRIVGNDKLIVMR